jgi:hypothetical protein
MGWTSGEGKKRREVCVRIIAAVRDHDITPFLTLRPPRLKTLRLPLRLRGLCIPRLPRRGCVLQVGELRQGGDNGHGNPRRSWHGGEAPSSEWWCGTWSEVGVKRRCSG